MAGLVMNARIAFVAAILLAAAPLAGCRRAPAAPPPLAGAALGGPFALIDQNGKPVSDRDFAGRYRAVYFGYSFCPDVCPTTLQALMQGYRGFAASDPADARKLVPIFVTIDPDRDTPAVLRQYVSAFGPELRGLTGTPSAIAAAAKEYGVYYRKEPAPKGGSGYLMDHSSQAILFGPDGQPIALIPTDQGAKAVADTLAQWVR
jgi:protein SCO1/2